MKPKKTILTICPSWPGQFKSVINACNASGNDYNIVAVCQIAKPEYIHKHDNMTILHDLAFTVGNMHQNAAQFALGVLRIKEHLKGLGLKPDLAFIQVGFGLEILSEALFPDIPTIGYFEWFENENAMDPYNMLLNTITTDYAKRCSALITPSQFQRNQFPVDIRRKLMVLHEGIDLELFKPPTIRLLDTSQLVITYVCRGLESVRCFMEFITTVKMVLTERVNVVVRIVGEDKAFYETTTMSYKTEAIKLLGPELADRVSFLGVLSKEQVRDVLQSSDVHIYFTKPRGISWSLLEAFACGCAVIASNVDGLREVTGEGGKANGPDGWCILTDHDDFESTKKKILDVLDDRDDERIQQLRRNARKFVEDNYDARVNGNKWRILIDALT